MLKIPHNGGVIIAGAYIIFVIGLLLYAMNYCTGLFCGAIPLMGTLPWPLFLDLIGMDITSTSWAVFWLSVLGNALILYIVFVSLQRWIIRR